MANKKLTKDLTNAVSYARPIVRTNGDPLDKTGFYETTTEATTYAAGADAYVGQIINIINDDVQPYVIKDEDGTLKRIVCDGDIIGVGCGGTGATTAAQALVELGITDASAAELNFCKDVTSPIQTQLNGKAPTAHASTGTSYGVGTATNYGHVKISDGDVATVAASDGLAAGMGHSHSNYSTTSHSHTTLPNNLELKSGNTYFTMTASSFTATSDKRLKENIVPYIPTKNTILDLPIYKFDFINNGKKNNIGCLAQDLQKICPEIVNTDSDGYLSIEESKIVYLLLEEVKQLRKELDELKR